ncbi:hypothetical protein FC83_GL000556 [Agrilactobacillus composti DSM 18527 = JCM 14202]|uniref:Isochorismatase-like domain-containing protein n=1 Tax=Agrilactobacillus composti DSM 18527 = JCM 14202 TaxID=1423734 RepID=X0PGS9_9LACO|nr:isochorismatase family protein [Agrilactobacillus composti]KRM31874.1 hypothetical protein FC83_GL000556 [Agrilactobacillus composti DSM 18527 = JCM 14202]GAF41269.1 nicotinamidase/isochorismatase family protein [Agrilactobacillus composti DSM 18527 = JCM 14202]
MTFDLNLTLSKTALVAIDLQQGILNTRQLRPNANQQVLTAANQIAASLKNTAALITLVNVDAATMGYLHPFDHQVRHYPADFGQLAMAIAADETAQNVIRVTKHNPGAFFGTDLDLQLRRRKIDTIILTGVVTTNGVYATALDAFQYGYRVILVADACADRDAALHDTFITKLFPKIARVANTAQVLQALATAKK